LVTRSNAKKIRIQPRQTTKKYKLPKPSIQSCLRQAGFLSKQKRWKLDEKENRNIMRLWISKFMLFMFSINKKDNTYIGLMHPISELITEETNIFDVFDREKCQLL
jgi:hypothetical protein